MIHDTIYGFFTAPEQDPRYVPGDASTHSAAGARIVLFVDDELLLAQLGTNLLERIGYRSICCTSGQQALSLFRADPDRYDLLITDLLMPDMGGLELAAACKKIRSKIPVVVCSGQSHLDADVEEHMRSLDIDRVLFKPFTMKELKAAVKDALRPHE